MDPVTDDTFEEKVLKNTQPVVVDFWAPWCGPCRALAPLLEEVAQEVEGHAHLYGMNIDENPTTPSQYGILSIPTLMLFQNGKLQDTKVGHQTKENLVKWVLSFT